ncbi:amino acid transporter [Nocardioides daedukensis]|uniref:Amino acid transporter n=1 Tax=Nocardioides daedukensis TaxID=634462 RepID=A0A7Y9UQ14_9ACTN|nr:APC family permease [Nocardioides daedukensis]NYG60193.1 amino acid transporter [Nocardioides daedukensis]
MADGKAGTVEGLDPQDESELKRSITGRLLYFYVLGDVLGSGIYVLIGAVAIAVGGAFWIAFAVGVTVATITGLAYAELVTKYPQAAGAALYVNKAFKNRPLSFLITVCMLSASFAAAGSLSLGFAKYFNEVWDLPPALLITLLFVVALTVVNFIGITESVVANMVMTFVELGGLLIILVIGVWTIVEGNADFGVLTQFETQDSAILGVISGVALAFFAMTGFENAANVAEETVNPAKDFPRALIGGMITAGILYVAVAMTAALVLPMTVLQDEGKVALIEVVKSGVLPVDVGFLGIMFAIIAMVAITNTTLVAVVTESRILYGMAREDVVPGVFAKVHESRRSPWVALIFAAVVISGLLLSPADLEKLASVTVVFTLFIYALVIVACLKLRGQDETGETFRANTALLVLGVLGNAVLLVYVVYDDPSSLIYCAALLGVGLVLFLAEMFWGRRDRSRGAERGDPDPSNTLGE